MHCFWASGLLVQQQAYLYDTCNLNIQTNYQKENVDACFFFFFLHWILAVCNVYWIFKTVYLIIFFTTLGTVVQFGKKKKRYFASSTALLPPWTTLPSQPPSSWSQAAGVWGGALIHTFVNCSAYRLRVKCFTSNVKGEIRFPDWCVYL